MHVLAYLTSLIKWYSMCTGWVNEVAMAFMHLFCTNDIFLLSGAQNFK